MIIETFGHEVLVAANIDTQHDVPFVLRRCCNLLLGTGLLDEKEKEKEML